MPALERAHEEGHIAAFQDRPLLLDRILTDEPVPRPVNHVNPKIRPALPKGSDIHVLRYGVSPGYQVVDDRRPPSSPPGYRRPTLRKAKRVYPDPFPWHPMTRKLTQDPLVKAVQVVDYVRYFGFPILPGHPQGTNLACPGVPGPRIQVEPGQTLWNQYQARVVLQALKWDGKIRSELTESVADDPEVPHRVAGGSNLVITGRSGDGNVEWRKLWHESLSG